MEILFNLYGLMNNGRYASVKEGIKFMFILFGLCCILMGGGRALRQKRRFDLDKLTAFECGFEPLGTTRDPFSMRFFLLALIFLIFDVEVVLLIPYVLRIKMVVVPLPFISKFLCFVFLVVLVLGLLHEYNEGRLD